MVIFMKILCISFIIVLCLVMLRRNQLVYNARTRAIDGWKAWSDLYMEWAIDMLNIQLQHQELDPKVIGDVFDLYDKFMEELKRMPSYGEQLFNIKCWTYEELTDNIDLKFKTISKQCVTEATIMLIQQDDGLRETINFEGTVQ